MQISKLDMKSLSVFAAVMRTHSLSVAAEQLGMSQPAVSQTIARLRTHFRDKLFVRTGQGTRPTARALELLEPIEEVLQIVRERVDGSTVFDPSTARRTFTFLSTDFGATVFLPKLTSELRRIAPAVRVRSVAVNSGEMKAQLESGEVDLAVGGFSELVAGFHQRPVYTDGYACIAGAKVGIEGAKITRAEYQQASHAIVTPLPPGYEAVEQLIRREVAESRILLEVPSFLSLLLLMRESDLLCTVPCRVGVSLARLAGLRAYPVPFRLARLQVRQYWHARVHNDPAHRWFRGLFNELFSPVQGAPFDSFALP